MRSDIAVEVDSVTVYVNSKNGILVYDLPGFMNRERLDKWKVRNSETLKKLRTWRGEKEIGIEEIEEKVVAQD